MKGKMKKEGFLRKKRLKTGDLGEGDEESFGERERASARGRGRARKTMSCRGGF